MQWFFIALAGSFLWALTNISDQYLVNKYSTGERGSGGLVLFSSLIGIFVAAAIGVFTTGLFQIPILDKLLLILAGGITVAWIILYFYALEVEDISSVITWFLTVPVFGYILGYIFLNEALSTRQLIGSTIVLFGALLISMDFKGIKMRIKWKPAFYMLTVCIMIAIIGIIFKYVTIDGNFWVSSFWQYTGLGVFGLIIYLFIPKYRNEFIAMNKAGGKKIVAINSISEIITIIGSLLTHYAFLLAPVALVYLTRSFELVMTFIFALILTKLIPSVLKEDLSKKVLLPKIAAILIIIFGSTILLT